MRISERESRGPLWQAIGRARATKPGAPRVARASSRPARRSLPPTVLVLLSMSSVQIGAALAKSLFATLGPAGTALLRVGIAAIVLLIAWRPQFRGHAWASYRVALLFGLTLAAMNLTFYTALNRVPLGVAVTLEFVGPLGVAVAGSRRLHDVLWVVLAAAGILVLAPLGTVGQVAFDPLGLVLSMVAGVFWAAYILLSARIGQAFSGGTGLTLAMTVAAIALLPIGVATAGATLLTPRLLLAGAAVALLSSVVPYSLELEALRQLPPRVFGILMSLEPALAAIAGWLVLHEHLGVRALVAIALVTAASIGAARTQAA